MQKLVEVEEAKIVMIEAIDWSVMKWLREKKRVRHMADRANAALDIKIAELKNAWDSKLKAAYQQSGANSKAADSESHPEVLAVAKKMKKAEAEAKAARDDAEKTFDDAEKNLSTSMAREGCRKAIHSWEVHEHVIKLAEAAQEAKAKA
jgi:hypothetical protein